VSDSGWHVTSLFDHEGLRSGGGTVDVVVPKKYVLYGTKRLR